MILSLNRLIADPDTSEVDVVGEPTDSDDTTNESVVEQVDDATNNPVGIDTDPSTVGSDDESEDDLDQSLPTGDEASGEHDLSGDCGEEGTTSEDAAEKLLATFDADGDGSLSKDELTAMLDNFWADAELPTGSWTV